MEVVKTIRPGQKGAGRFLRKYGKQLVVVRYRRSPDEKKTFTTVELIVDERGYEGKNINLVAVHGRKRKEWVAVPIAFHELDLRHQAKQLGAQWSVKQKVWVILYQHAVELGIIHRQRPDLMALIDDVDLYV